MAARVTARRRQPRLARRRRDVFRFEAGGEGRPLAVKAVGVSALDEIGDVARAFDQVHRQAVKLAANEAVLRTSMNAIFVNLSRRSQSLLLRLVNKILADYAQVAADVSAQGAVLPERLGAGGYGDPCERDLRELERDLADGKVTPDAAEANYACVVERSSLTIDREATARLRAKRWRCASNGARTRQLSRS